MKLNIKSFYKTGDDFLNRVENPRIPFIYYLCTLFTVISLRNFLDIFSDTAVVSFRLFPFERSSYLSSSIGIVISLSHLYLFWICLLLTLSLIYAYVTKEHIEKPMRTIFSFSWIILFTPLVDLILSQGKGIEQRYLFPKGISGLFPLPYNLDPGEKVTICVSLFLTFLYCITKTQNIIKTAWGIFLAYLCNILSLIPTFIIKQTLKLFRVELEFMSALLVIRVFLIYLFFLLTLIIYLHNKDYFKSLLKGLNPLIWLHFILIFILGMLLFRNHIESSIFTNAGTFLLSVISITLAWLFGIMLGDIHTAADDLMVYDVPKGTYKKMAIGIFIFAVCSAISVNATTLFFMLLAIGLGFIYNFLPLQLKRIPFFSKILLSVQLLIVLMLGWLFAGGQILRFPHIFTLYFLIFLGGCINFIDLGDSHRMEPNIKTLPLVLGENTAKLMVGSIFLISYLVIPWLFLENKLFLPSLFLGLLQFYEVNRKDYREMPVLLISTVTLVSLIIWLNSFRN